MDNLESLKSSFDIKVCTTLLTMGLVLDLKPDDMMEFFATQAYAMLAVSPNYNLYGKTAPAWIMRGFYPETSIFFKLTVVKNDSGVFAKASIPMIKVGSKRRYDSFVKSTFAAINDNITKKMENAILGTSHEIKPLVSMRTRMPRCMSPKGIKIFNYNKN